MVTPLPSAPSARGRPYNGYTAARPAVLGTAKLLFLGISQASLAAAAPLRELLRIADDDDLPKDPDDPSLWLYMGIAMILVLLGGAFAGLTIALMGQDGIYLQVIATSGEGKEQKHAQNVFNLLMKGKHWVLVTLLLANVIVNETLPIVLDRSLGGGWPAVLGSTVLIVIFGEVIPQSVCVRYGLQIGSFMAPFVLILMYILAPVAWPTAKLLDRMLGEDHGTVYKKSGLKTLVTLHKTLGTSPSDRLNQDEVTIISAVLDLKDKPVGDIMTPMEDVFTMAADTVLDEKTMDIILSAGYSRIPIHEPGNEFNFVGMLLVKILITYDPEDCKRVGDFALATLPETRPETSCLDIVNFFQEGKSHMVLVSENPGEDYGAMGVVTLEDVIEELIGEEIIDESDVYIDVHKAIRRMAPAPKARVHKGQVVMDSAPPLPLQEGILVDVGDGKPGEETTKNLDKARKHWSSPGDRSQSPAPFSTSPKTTFMMRRSSSAADRSLAPIAVRGTANDMREHLKHLGPSNLASRPKTTRYQSVKIKPGNTSNSQRHSVSEEPYRDMPAPHGGEGEGLLQSAGKGASDGVQAVQQGYGSMDRRPGSARSRDMTNRSIRVDINGSSEHIGDGQGSRSAMTRQELGNIEPGSSPGASKRRYVRSGSITENIIDMGGVRKVVLETNSSSDPEDVESPDGGTWPYGKNKSSSSTNVVNGNDSSVHTNEMKAEDVKKRKRRRNRKGNGRDESSTQGGDE